MSNRVRKMTIRKNKTPHCCGQRMIHKSSYDKESEEFYFCRKCGKEKFIKKEWNNEKNNE